VISSSPASRSPSSSQRVVRRRNHLCRHHHHRGSRAPTTRTREAPCGSDAGQLQMPAAALGVAPEAQGRWRWDPGAAVARLMVGTVPTTRRLSEWGETAPATFRKKTRFQFPFLLAGGVHFPFTEVCSDVPAGTRPPARCLHKVFLYTLWVLIASASI
jgi:hypothetical protein